MNFVSIGQLYDSDYFIYFSSTPCHVQNLQSQKLIRIGRRQGELYVLDKLRILDVAVSSVNLSSFHLNSYSFNFYLWHSRLGLFMKSCMIVPLTTLFYGNLVTYILYFVPTLSILNYHHILLFMFFLVMIKVKKVIVVLILLLKNYMFIVLSYSLSKFFSFLFLLRLPVKTFNITKSNLICINLFSDDNNDTLSSHVSSLFTDITLLLVIHFSSSCITFSLLFFL